MNSFIPKKLSDIWTDKKYDCVGVHRNLSKLQCKPFLAMR